jgi:hypothetical protein
MAKYRIINRTTYEGTIPDGVWTHQNESPPLWSGDELPTDLDQEIAFVESKAIRAQQVPYDITPNVIITEHGPVLQEFIKLGSFPVKFAWEDYEPKIDDDSADYKGWEWSRNKSSASR